MVFLSPERLGSPVFTANLFGSGTARLLQPATLTLIGSGIAGLVLRSRRRRRAQAM
jgi:hypothetical protein